MPNFVISTSLSPLYPSTSTKNMKISSIIHDTTTTTAADQKNPVPRPLNCFMTYRLEKQKEIMERCPAANHRDISKITAKWWKELSLEGKKPYIMKAQQAKMEHALLYPDYKFKPKKRTQKTRVYKQQPPRSGKELENKAKLSNLFHQKSSSQLNNYLYQDRKEDDICCATCYFSPSNSNCFTNSYDDTVLPLPRITNAQKDNYHNITLPSLSLSSPTPLLSSLYSSLPSSSSEFYNQHSSFRSTSPPDTYDLNGKKNARLFVSPLLY